MEMIRCCECKCEAPVHYPGCSYLNRATLRDQFAIAALRAITPYVDRDLLPEVATDGEDYYHFDFFAHQAYQFADAMMEARKTTSASTPSQSTAKPPFSVGSCPECAGTGFVGFKTDGTGRQSCSRGCPEYVYGWEKSGGPSTPSETPKERGL